jgi:hypothetical protein
MRRHGLHELPTSYGPNHWIHLELYLTILRDLRPHRHHYSRFFNASSTDFVLLELVTLKGPWRS